MQRFLDNNKGGRFNFHLILSSQISWYKVTGPNVALLGLP